MRSGVVIVCVGEIEGWGLDWIYSDNIPMVSLDIDV